MTVPTLRGPIADSDLGTTLMHEHVFLVDPEIAANVPTSFDEDAAAQRAVTRLTELKAAGVDTIVDLTVLGLGRDVPRLLRIADRVPVHVVVATGIYTFHDLPAYFLYRTTEAMADLFVREIEDGIGDTGVRAGIIKCATDEDGLTRGVEKVLRAAARAHRRTGVPITTHTHAASRRGLDQLRVFADEGVDPSRVVIGHSGDTTDLDYLEELAATGAYLGMDRFGVDAVLGFDDRVGVVAELCRRGRADRLVLSHDASCVSDLFDDAMLRRAAPRWDYLHIGRDVLPALRDRGVTEAQIATMLVDNPRTILRGGAPY